MAWGSAISVESTIGVTPAFGVTGGTVLTTCGCAFGSPPPMFGSTGSSPLSGTPSGPLGSVVACGTGVPASVVALPDGDAVPVRALAVTLPGVARKTANVVRGVCFGLADGVVVDTHVARISGLLGWTRQKDPVRIERDLMELHPHEAWIELSHRLIHHGREICIAGRPRCEACPLLSLCPGARPERPAAGKGPRHR